MLRSKSSTGGVLNLVKRLFSSSNQQLSGLPPTVLEQLAVAPFAVQKVSEQMRAETAENGTRAAHQSAICVPGKLLHGIRSLVLQQFPAHLLQVVAILLLFLLLLLLLLPA